MAGERKHQVMLIRDEGLRLKAYKDTLGNWTIGVGHLLPRDIAPLKLFWYLSVGISEAAALQLLDQDFEKARKDCLAIFGAELFESWSLHRQLGWCNMAFNLGRKKLLGFQRTLEAARTGNWPRVEAGLRGSLWATQVKGRAERVIALIVREEWPYA